MTNREAIQFLNNMIGEEHGRSIGAEGFYRELCAYHVDALRMAIKALEQEPCDDAISRDMALEKMADYVASGYADSVEDFEEYSRIICQLPSVKPQEPCKDANANQHNSNVLNDVGQHKNTLEGDLISRQAAIEKIHWLGLDNDTAIKCDLAIRALPSVIPSRPTGHWILHTDASGNSWHTCPTCGHIAYTLTHFCPDCGTRLEAPS